MSRPINNAGNPRLRASGVRARARKNICEPPAATSYPMTQAQTGSLSIFRKVSSATWPMRMPLVENVDEFTLQGDEGPTDQASALADLLHDGPEGRFEF